MKKLKLFIAVLLLPTLLTGCWDLKVYERVGFILQMGIESGKENIVVSYNMPVVVGGNAKEQTEFLSSEVLQIREFREYARRISSKIIEGGKLQQLLFSEDIASRGILQHLELFERDTVLPSSAHIILVDGSPKEIMNALQTLNDKPLPSFYINNLIENNIRNGYVRELRVHSFTTQYFSNTIDPIAPVIRLFHGEGKGVQLVGTALFSGDKMVGRIAAEKAPMLLSLMNVFKGGEFVTSSLQSGGSYNKGAAISISKPKRDFNLTIEDNVPIVDISLKFSARLEEFKFDAISNQNSRSELEEKISKEMTDLCVEILKYSQDIGSDPLGIGEVVRSKHNLYWKSISDWHEVYKDIKFNVKVTVDLNKHGVIK